MTFAIPDRAAAFGFHTQPGGAHTSRTMMLDDLVTILGETDADAGFDTYRDRIVTSNILGKPTVATRAASVRHLRELYGLTQDVLLFRALRDLWPLDPEARPLLAVLCAIARDPSFRASAGFIAATPPGDLVTPSAIAGATDAAFPGRYNPTTLGKIARNAASSWQQAGHLVGRATKARATVVARPAAVAYALLLGHLCGARGDLLFTTPWMQLLDSPIVRLRELAHQAAREGMIDLRAGGGVTDIGFRHLLRDIEVEP